jgi:SAM-dependent methyltransferase
VSDIERQTRATTFGSAAQAYQRYRPAPPADAAAWALGPCRDLAIDLAAGTGKLTQSLVGQVDRVLAVDIDSRMLAVIGRRLPGVARVAARGEVLPLRSGAAGAVVISSAWHWLDPDLAWPELSRVIRPGGTLAILWGGPDRGVPWVRDVLGHRLTDQADQSDRAGGDGDDREAWVRRRQVDIPLGGPFYRPEERLFSASIPFAVADFPGLAASYSRVMVLPVARQRQTEEAVAARAAARPELVGVQTVDLPLRCRVWRAVRR